MDLLNIRSHFQEGARMAAGSFMSPLTNAIGEQRRLVESLAVVSKVRVDECKHMMTWSKSQTEDLGDVLLKLNLLIRKISDYEIKFGSQYEQFREKVKYLRTKDDTLCEMGRRQTDLQTKIVESSKNHLRTAKALLKQKELEEIKKETEPDATKLQHLKRQLIKDAYTVQLNAIIELGKKMQIIGEHGNQLLEHIDLTCSATSYNDGRETEDILQAARIALENWDQLVKADSHAVIVHPPPAVSVSEVSAGQSDLDDRDVTEEQTSETLSPPASLKAAKGTEATATELPPLPPRSSNRDRQCDEDPKESEEEALRRREELEIKQALELSLAMSSPSFSSSAAHGKDISDLNLSAEELRFVMGEVAEAAALKKAATVVKKPVDIAADDSDAEHDIVAPKVISAPRIVRSPQVVESVGNVVSQQGPRPWVPEEQEDTPKMAAVDKPTTVAHEELASSSADLETMGENPTVEAPSTNSAPASKHKPLESMGTAPEHPLESMGSEPVALESMGQDGHSSAENVSFVPMPQVPSLDGIREQKLFTKQQQQQQPPPSPFPLSPELQYLQVQNSPQIPNQLSPQVSPIPAHLGTPVAASISPQHAISSTTGYQTPASYKPSTTYVPQASKQKNRLSGSHALPPPRDGATSPAHQIQLQYQQQQQQQMYQQQYQQQQAYQQSYQRGSHSQYAHQYQQPHHTSVQQQQQYQQQQQKQLHDFYYTPSEQEYQQQHQQRFQQQQHQQQQSNAGQSQRHAPNYWSYPDLDQQYSDTSSPSPSHISLIPDNSASPTISSAGGPASDHAYKVEL
ncbi:hypothetical protein EC968_000121 [Mortierella alpina]|nr:hypothetical protein EC968_000121 [Mortierella alpina]